MKKYAKDKKLVKEKDAELTGDDIREGLAAIVAVKVALFISNACDIAFFDCFRNQPTDSGFI